MALEAEKSEGADPLLVDDLLSEEERAVRDRVRAFSDEEVIPIMAECWEKAEFPFGLVPKIAGLGICGDTIKGYGCAGLSHVASGLVAMELARGDGSVYTFFGAQSGFAMNSIAALGSEEQKERWLPPMARMERIGAFALTEPEHGSDVVMLETTARRKGAEYVLNGEKRWIGNGTFADVIVVWGRDEEGGSGVLSLRRVAPAYRRARSRAKPPSAPGCRPT